MNKRIFYIVLVFLLSFFVLSNVAYSQQNGMKYPKDPQTALVLSIIDPGLGMFYTDKPSMGILFWSLDKVLFFSTLISIFDIQISFPPDVGIYVKFELREMTAGNIITSSLFGLLFIGFRVFSVFHSRNEALSYNKKLFADKMSVCIYKDTYFECSLDDKLYMGIKFYF